MFGFAKKLVKQAEGIIAPEISTKSASYGFRVLYVEPDSEAFHAGIEPLFDFVIAANGVRFDARYRPAHEPSAEGVISVEQEQSPADEFSSVVQGTEGKLVLELWCAKGRSTRIVTLPNPAKQPTGLGLSLQWSPLSVADHVWHVLNVVPNSPANRAGLVSHEDYIVAAENGALEEGGEYLLGRVVSRATTTEGVLFYVYNREFDLVRPVRVFPTHDGKLGCGVGYGLLHALPQVSRSDTRVTPGSMVFDDQEPELDAHYLDASVASRVPAPAPPSAATPTSPTPSTARHHHHKSSHGAVPGLTDYFNEQSEISKQIDRPSKISQSAVPPPPKASS